MAWPDAVREHLERVLNSVAFRNSRRASAMLRYAVERALSGQGETLKERTIGVEVFGRPAGYDTAADHVVRSTAGDVRRRLAQYYQDSPDASPMRITFAPGSYVPQFETGAPRLATSNLDGFWAPLLESGRQVLLCVGGPGLAPLLDDSTPAKFKDQLTLADVFALETEKVAFSDAVTLATLAGFLAARGATYRVAHESETGLDDFRQGPSVLIGALNNDWGLRLGGQLRFTFSFDREALVCSIRDRGQSVWNIGLNVPFTSLREDRGIVTRVTNETTGQPMVVAGGATMLGTLAAGELLTNAPYMPAGEWERPNAQIVFATTVLRGSAAPPRVLETVFW
jgi:hypothetical protein